LNFYDFAPNLAMKGAQGLFFQYELKDTTIPGGKNQNEENKSLENMMLVFMLPCPLFKLASPSLTKSLLKFTKINIFFKILT
jgi:hypothetical protein